MNRIINRLVLVMATLVLWTGAAIGAEFCASNVAELQDALDTAEINGEDDIIKVVQGTYNGNFYYYSTERHSITLLGGYTVDCLDRILDPSNTVLSGDRTRSVLYLCNYEGGNLEVEGFTMTNGAAASGSGLCVLALSEKNMAGHIFISRNVITGNSNQGSCHGGGAFVASVSDEGTAGNVTLTENIITENTGASGGGVYIEATSSTGTSGTISLINNQFRDNTANYLGGGAKLSCGTETGKPGDVFITDNTVARNSSTWGGGGIAAYTGSYYGSSGNITITGNTITDNVSSGHDEAGGGGIYAINSTDGPAKVMDIIIRDNIISRNSTSGHGGGVLADSYAARDGETGDIIFINNTISDNHSDLLGGGLYAKLWGGDRAGDITIADSFFSGNTPQQVYAKSYVDSDGLKAGDITLANNAVNGESSASSGDGFDAYSGSGGQYDPSIRGDITITNNTITGLDGYGLSARGYDITMTGCRITDNTGQGTELSGHDIVVEDSEFIRNQSRGIEVYGKDITITGNIIKGNTFTGGGSSRVVNLGSGILIKKSRNWPNNRAEVTNNIIAGNKIYDGAGGGLGYRGDDNCTIYLTHNTITQNTATVGNSYDSGFGGGAYLSVYYPGTGNFSYIHNNIIWGNTATATVEWKANDIQILGQSDRYGYNNIYSDAYPPYWTDSENNIDVDPLFADTSDPDPVNWDFHIASASPAIDAGNAFYPLADVDFEGDLRPQGSGHDIGADEFKDTDGDGIADHEENGPDGDIPDYNGDGSPDYTQSNVASLHTYDRQYYISLVSPNGTALTGVQSAETPDNLPPGMELPYGLFKFFINNVSNTTTAIIQLPDGETPNTYVKCDSNDDCYEFLYDGETGAEISGNIITLHFVDGGRGDQDGIVNGVIVDPGAPGIVPNQSPVASCQDVTVSTDPGTCSAFASVDGGSFDPNGDPISLSIHPAGPYPLGETQVTLTVMDDKGASDSCTARVTVVDREPPNLDPLPMVTGECSAEITSIPVATDNCGGAITGTTTDPLKYTKQGSYEVHWTFDDGNNNIATRTQTVVVRDITPPALTAPANVTVEAIGSSGQVVDIGTPVVTDNCDSAPSVSHNAPVLFPIGTTTVTWTGTDSSGNTATAMQHITVQDTTAPVVTLSSPKDGETYPNTQGSIPIVYHAEDLGDADLDIFMALDGETITGEEINLCGMASGAHTLIITASDDAGNRAAASTTFMVEPLAFKSFKIKYMKIHWARDKHKATWKKRFRQFRHKKDDTFSVFGNIRLPEGVSLKDLSKTATVKVSIAGQSGSDTVVFRNRPLRRWGTVWKYKGNEQPPGQGMNIHRMSIWWAPQGSKGAGRGSFHISGILQLPGNIGKDTTPPVAVITLEIPVSPKTGCGSLRGEERVKFKVFKRINIWSYFKRHRQRH